MSERIKTGGAPKPNESTFNSSGSYPPMMGAQKLLPEWCGYGSSLRTLDLHLIKAYTASTECAVFELVALWVGADFSPICRSRIDS
jgi:hypothetical protein